MIFKKKHNKVVVSFPDIHPTQNLQKELKLLVLNSSKETWRFQRRDPKQIRFEIIIYPTVFVCCQLYIFDWFIPASLITCSCDCFCFFIFSFGGLILDKTVSHPRFEGMAVFTPVINGKKIDATTWSVFWFLDSPCVFLLRVMDDCSEEEGRILDLHYFDIGGGSSVQLKIEWMYYLPWKHSNLECDT